MLYGIEQKPIHIHLAITTVPTKFSSLGQCSQTPSVPSVPNPSSHLAKDAQNLLASGETVVWRKEVMSKSSEQPIVFLDVLCLLGVADGSGCGGPLDLAAPGTQVVRCPYNQRWTVLYT